MRDQIGVALLEIIHHRIDAQAVLARAKLHLGDALAAQLLVGEQAVKSPAVAARLAPLGILQAYASPEAQAAEMREEFRRVSEMAKRAGLTK